jgi:outer membrane protein TolC
LSDFLRISSRTDAQRAASDRPALTPRSRPHPPDAGWVTPRAARVVLAALGALAAGVAPAAASAEGEALTLDAAYARARSQSVELSIAEERIRIAALNVDRAWALLKPNLSANLGYTRLEPAPQGFPDVRPLLEACGTRTATDGTQRVDVEACRAALQSARTDGLPRQEFVGQDTVTFRAQLTWNVLNGRALPLLSSARANVDVERLRRDQDEKRLLFQVARAFYAAVASQEAIEAATRAEARARARLDLAGRRAEVGEQPALAHEVERLSLEQAQVEVRRARHAAAQARAALAFVLGDVEPPAAVVRPPRPTAPIEGDDALAERAARVREDVRLSAAAVAIAENTLDDAWWKFAPTLGLFGGYRYSNVAGLSGQNGEWSFGANLAWQLYDGGVRYADLNEAQAQIRSARHAHARVLLALRQELERARTRLEGARLGEARAAIAQRLAEARQALARTQAAAGTARPLEVLEADDLVRDAEQAVAAATLEVDLAVLELEQAAGRFAPLAAP